MAFDLRPAVARLRAAGVPDPARDARRLLAHALGVAPDRLTLRLGDPVAVGQSAAFEALIEARAGRAPVSHLTGSRMFWGREFTVTPQVLDPRPETEGLMTLALAEMFDAVIDLGTGSGCILASLLAERPGAEGVGTDASDEALMVARRNLDRHAPRGRLIRADWWGGVGEMFDLVVSNPPYLALEEMAGLAPEVLREPSMALTDGADGLTAYRAIVAGAPDRMTPGGRLLVEIGPTQGAPVSEMMRAAGLVEVAVHPDLDGRDRVVSARRDAARRPARRGPATV
ncbi:MAG: peptide chain release factor N(5)-glutamine methyltransferase [Paracoccaceae bacterium]